MRSENRILIRIINILFIKLDFIYTKELTLFPDKQ